MKDITIYSTNTCAYCKMVKRYLDSKGQSYKEVNLDEHPEERAEATRLSGALTVPITHVVDGDSDSVVIGWNVASLARALAG